VITAEKMLFFVLWAKVSDKPGSQGIHKLSINKGLFAHFDLRGSLQRSQMVNSENLHSRQ
jgi:hypothetical protein